MSSSLASPVSQSLGLALTALSLLVTSVAQAEIAPCARNVEAIKQNQLITKALGTTYNPFVKWKGPMGTAILAQDDGSLGMHLPGWIAAWKNRPREMPLALEVCMAAEDAKPYAKGDGK